MDAGPAADFYFVGDLTDPWVARMASALPGRVGRLQAADALPRPWPDELLKAKAIILHRTWLTNHDAERLQALRKGATNAPRFMLCTGLLPRYHQLERWVPLVDRIVPETLAPGLLWRWLRPAGSAQGLEQPPRGPRPAIAIVSRVHEIRQLLLEIVREAGYPAHTGRDWSQVPPGTPALWDVPVLEPDWESEFQREAASRAVLALAGFLDRNLATRMLDAGSRACLDLPCDPADLIYLLERLNSSEPHFRAHPKHEPLAGRHLPPPVVPSASVAGDSRAS